MDIYLFDQLLKERIAPGMRILDAGCGEGRNLVYFLREDYDVFAVDRSEQAIHKVRKLAMELNNELSEDQFRVEAVEKLSFANDTFDVVISCAVLHFAEDERHFQRMVSEMWRVLKPGGLFFARLASNIGIESQVRSLGGNRYELPDGTERYLVDAEALHHMAEKLHGLFVDPIKTVQVEGLRCMSTWCMKKPHILFFDPIQDMLEEKTDQQQDRSDGSILDITERSTT